MVKREIRPLQNWKIELRRRVALFVLLAFVVLAVFVIEIPLAAGRCNHEVLNRLNKAQSPYPAKYKAVKLVLPVFALFELAEWVGVRLV